MHTTILCFNLRLSSKIKKVDPGSLGVIVTPRSLGIPINEYLEIGMTTINKNPAHVLIQDGLVLKNLDDFQFGIMRCLRNIEPEWPNIIVIAEEEINRGIKNTYPVGDVKIFTPDKSQSLSIYDVFRDSGESLFVGLISEKHLFS